MIGFKIKNVFFDRPAVVKLMDDRTRRVFNRFGGYVRKAARSSIKDARKEKTKLARKRIREKQGRDSRGRFLKVSQGDIETELAKMRDPVSRPGKPPLSHTGLLKDNILYGYDPKRSVVIGPVKLNAKGEDVPRVLEYGGQTTVVQKKKKKRVKIKARPYMQPAFEKGQEELPRFWRESVK